MIRNQALVMALAMFFLVWGSGPSNGQDEPGRRIWTIAQLEDSLSEVEIELEKIAEARKTSEVRLDDAKSQMAQLQEKRADLLNQQNALGVSSASYDEIMRLLQTQKVQLSIELAGIEARREAMIEQHGSSQKSQRESNQAIVGPLQELANIQKERLDQVVQLKEAGAAPDTEVLNAKQQLLEVQIRLAQVMHPDEAGPASPVDRELLNVSLARAEAVARLNKVNQLLDEYVHARTPIDSLSRVTSEIGAADGDLRALPNQVRQYDDMLKATSMRRDHLRELLKRAKDADDRK